MASRTATHCRHFVHGFIETSAEQQSHALLACAAVPPSMFSVTDMSKVAQEAARQGDSERRLSCTEKQTMQV